MSPLKTMKILVDTSFKTAIGASANTGVVPGPLTVIAGATGVGRSTWRNMKYQLSYSVAMEFYRRNPVKISNQMYDWYKARAVAGLPDLDSNYNYLWFRRKGAFTGDSDNYYVHISGADARKFLKHLPVETLESKYKTWFFIKVV